MKAITIILAFLISGVTYGQQPAGSGMGKVFGTKPNMAGIMDASKLETSMGNKTRIGTTIKGKIIKVTKQKGGWFEMEGGNGKIITAHFKDYKVMLPSSLKGKTVIAEGAAEKQFIADDMQHFAGDTVKGKKQHGVKSNPKQKLTLEVTGLMVQ